MKFIYLVRARDKNDVRNYYWDVVEGVVVCATSPKHARQLVSEVAGGEKSEIWLDTKRTKTKMIGLARLATKSGVFLCAYR